MPTFSLETSAPPDDFIVVTDLSDGRCQLVYCMLKGRMQWRYTQGTWNTEQDWIADRPESSHSDVVLHAIHGTTLEQHPIRCEILKDRQRSPRLRQYALGNMNRTDPMTLQTLVDVLDDQTAYEAWSKPLPNNHPLKPLATFCRNADRREFYGEDKKPTPIGCLGDEALKRLKKITQQDIGKDKAAWTKWIDTQGPAE